MIGFKPSRGLISTVGLVPACKSLDCISVMAGSIDDVDRVFDVIAARDDNDAWARDRGPRHDGAPIRVGLPPVDELEFFGDDAMRRAHLAFREHLAAHGTRRRRVPGAVPGRRVTALPGAVGRRAAGRVR